MAKITQVDLFAASIPVIGWLADHHWLVVEAGGRRDRWEVWQWSDHGGESWGHLHRNLLHPLASVGNGATRRLQTWTGAAAADIAARIEQGPTDYPWCQRYWLWPGPNSNTFVQWVLGDRYRLGARALGKSFYRFSAAPKPLG